MTGGRVRLNNCRSLLTGAVVAEASVVFADGVIERVDRGGSTRDCVNIDVQGCWVLPGIVDLHCEALIKHLAPRSTELQSIESAQRSARRDCLAAGITTPVFTVNATLEPGIASIDACAAILRASTDLVHLRVELSAATAVPDEAVADPRVALVGINNHASNGLSGWDEQRHLRYMRRRSTLSHEDERRLVDAGRQSESELLARLGSVAARAKAPVCFHDLRGPSLVDACMERGIRIAEFVVDDETAHYAAARGMHTVLGAPNVLRGGSHNGQVSAEQSILDGLCGCLCSDYYLDALWQAPFVLARTCTVSFAQAWSLVSSAPAELLDLHDRGAIERGARADLLLIDDAGPFLLATWREGMLGYASESFLQSWLSQSGGTQRWVFGRGSWAVA
jgi:alpha-D-ribose 1-methylphosphonate 5-triphosphate diphosphatase